VWFPNFELDGLGSRLEQRLQALNVWPVWKKPIKRTVKTISITYRSRSRLDSIPEMGGCLCPKRIGVAGIHNHAAIKCLPRQYILLSEPEGRTNNGWRMGHASGSNSVQTEKE
jgi:hypothetical protein